MTAFFLIVALVLVLLLCGLYGIYRYVFYSPARRRQATVDTADGVILENDGDATKERIRYLYDLPHERVTIRSFDGLTLSARIYAGDADKPVDICCHGYRGSALRDMSGGATVLLEQRHTLILIDERAHMHSEGHSISFGINERRDLYEWVRYAVDRYGSDVRINLVGISLGGATVLMTASMPLPENVRTICADCPYNAPKDIIIYVAERLKLPAHLLYPLIAFSGFLFGGFWLSEMTAARAVKDTDIPILIIHGDADTLVPAYMSEQVRIANVKRVERHTFPEAEHGLSFIRDEKRYRRLLIGFLRRHDAL